MGELVQAQTSSPSECEAEAAVDADRLSSDQNKKPPTQQMYPEGSSDNTGEKWDSEGTRRRVQLLSVSGGLGYLHGRLPKSSYK